MADRRIPSGNIEVLIDESMFPDPRLTLAGAVVLQDQAQELGMKISELRTELLGLSFLADNRTFETFRKHGFHATEDSYDIKTRFIHLMAGNPGAKLFIEYSTHTARADLSAIQVIALLELRLVEIVLRKYHWSPKIYIIFETNDAMNSRYERIARAAARHTGFKGMVTVQSGKKMQPATLALVDYALHLYGRAHQSGTKDLDRRNWKAVRPMVSSVRHLDAGGVDLARRLVRD